MAERLKQRFYDGQYCVVSKEVAGSTSTLIMYLCSWIRCCMMLNYLSQLDGTKQAANLMDKNFKKFTETMDNWKLLSRCRFLHVLGN